MKVSEIAKKIIATADLIVDSEDPTSEEMLELAESLNYLEREIDTLRKLIFKLEHLSDEDFWTYIAKLMKLSPEYEKNEQIVNEISRRIKNFSSGIVNYEVLKIGQIIDVDVETIYHPYHLNLKGKLSAKISHRASEFSINYNTFIIPMDSQVQQSFIRIIDHANKLYEAINCGITTGGELYGRRYSCFRFNNDESANSFIMAMHTVFKEDWGVLKVEGNQIFVANNKDQGEEI